MGKKVRIGIDVGGTFTDAVALDNETYEIVAAKKIPTTHKEGVAVGIVKIIQEMMHGCFVCDLGDGELAGMILLDILACKVNRTLFVHLSRRVYGESHTGEQLVHRESRAYERYASLAREVLEEHVETLPHGRGRHLHGCERRQS